MRSSTKQASITSAPNPSSKDLDSAVKPDASHMFSASAHSHLPCGDKDGKALLNNVIDFLNIMYGKNSCADYGEKKRVDITCTSPVKVSASSGGPGHRLSTRASLYKRTLGTVQLPHTASEETAAPRDSLMEEVEKVKDRNEDDYITQLLNYLMHKHAIRTVSEDCATMGPEQETNRDRNEYEKYTLESFSSLQSTQRDGIDMSNFVNQALDSFLRSGTQINSTCSVLSALEMDTNFAKLVSFQTQSNLQNVPEMNDVVSETLKPMFVGQQALFKSVDSVPKNELTESSLSTIHLPNVTLPEPTVIKKGCSEETKSVSLNSETMTLCSKAFNLCNHSGTLGNDIQGDMGQRMSLSAPDFNKEENKRNTLDADHNSKKVLSDQLNTTVSK